MSAEPATLSTPAPPVTDDAPARIRLALHPGNRFVGLVLPIVALLCWEGAVRAGWIAANLLPPPSELAATLRELVTGDALPAHIAVSVVRVLAGFAMGAVLGIVLGTAVALNRWTAALLDPTFQALRAIPSLAWVPLLLLWLGIDEAPKVVLIAIGAFFPVYVAAQAGIRNVDRKLVEVGVMAGLRRRAIIRRILVPAMLPHLFTGLRTGLSVAWMFLVAAELIAATRGLGYLLSDGRETGRADIVIVAILILAVLGKLSDSVLRALESRSLAWRDSALP
ncbi:ABC transporter permease [Ralstonia insidiosa]|uniref:ABC transporter permease n=1 Tax=Ralstonia insidiosa TaxID=190721 RepID=UPI000CEDBC36|nr:ABC transporter permease [Ralstonia insidiosa]